VSNNKVRAFDWQLRYEPNKVRKAIQKALEIKEDQVLQRYPTTARKVVAEYDGRTFTELAVVKLHPPDVWDAEQGRAIAFDMATGAIAKRILAGMRKQRLNAR